MEPSAQQPQTFYRWVDAQGTVHVVGSLDAVPAAERAQLEQVVLKGREAPIPLAAGFRPDWASAALGFGAALLLALLIPRGWKGATRVALVLAVGALVTGAYLATVRRSVGLETGGAFSSPSAVIQDARDAVNKMNERQRLRDQQLEEMKKEGK
jgi:hypothetical protein